MQTKYIHRNRRVLFWHSSLEQKWKWTKNKKKSRKKNNSFFEIIFRKRNRLLIISVVLCCADEFMVYGLLLHSPRLRNANANKTFALSLICILDANEFNTNEHQQTPSVLCQMYRFDGHGGREKSTANVSRQTYMRWRGREFDAACVCPHCIDIPNFENKQFESLKQQCTGFVRKSIPKWNICSCGHKFMMQQRWNTTPRLVR